MQRMLAAVFGIALVGALGFALVRPTQTKMTGATTAPMTAVSTPAADGAQPAGKPAAKSAKPYGKCPFSGNKAPGETSAPDKPASGDACCPVKDGATGNADLDPMGKPKAKAAAGGACPMGGGQPKDGKAAADGKPAAGGVCPMGGGQPKDAKPAAAPAKP